MICHINPNKTITLEPPSGKKIGQLFRTKGKYKTYFSFIGYFTEFPAGACVKGEKYFQIIRKDIQPNPRAIKEKRILFVVFYYTYICIGFNPLPKSYGKVG